MPVSVHPIKAKIWAGIQSGKITDGMTLRAIGKLSGCNSPQQIKSHLEVMKKMGTIDYVRGQYHFER